MAPIPLSVFSGISTISRDISHSASLTSRTTTLLKPISTFLQPTNAELPSPSNFAKILTRLISRQATSSDPSVIPTTYGEQNNSSSPGTIVGIVLGSVGGFLLLLWLLYTCSTMRRSAAESTFTEDVTFHENSRRRSHNSRRSSRPHSRRVSATEKVEIRRQRSRSPTPVRVVREEVRQEVRRPPPVERVVVEERREVRRSRDERSSGTSGGNSDEVVVIEEHDPPRRSKSKRERRNSGFRTVDPLSVGGIVGGEGRRGERRR
ncbi:7e819bfa-3068-4bca-8d7c-48c80982a51e [Sclerotinia trifoliorum]|uniref:7e819bfa-3068-4bca-8d7c-48c80982a51e n=1 Tax=Sclerotinia trifoliorum TaxID=28548 RepID=A0A8H2VX97_9HELO|nr:7e819bfa-3068-4bca-8d7c-48c80982a51e [Sclerotinia trifoliorum]